MYVFYGKVTTRNGHEGPPITVIHAAIQQMMYRMDKHIMKNFAELVTLVKRDPSLLVFLTDGGLGEAPVELLVAVENGFRAAALHRQLIFASDSIVSQLNWSNPNESWRHRSTYYVVSRILLESPNLSNYKSFVLEDYQQRKQLFKTFEERHLPIVSGMSTPTTSPPYP